MYLIAGLGNPGRRYAQSRHNVGFMVLDAIGERLGIPVTQKKFNSLVGEGRFSGQKVVLLKPQTFMNLSGEAIAPAVRFYKPDPDKVVVIYDDVDLPVGTLRIRKKGGPGTHNGMRSVVQMLGTGDFPRFRIGVGNPDREDLAGYVLGRARGTEKEELEAAIRRAADAALCMIEDDLDLAMNRYNGNHQHPGDQ